MVERVERQESTGRDTIYMSNMMLGNNINHNQHQIRAVPVNHHSAVSEMNKTNPALFDISNGRVSPSRMKNRSEILNNHATDSIVVTRVDNTIQVSPQITETKQRPLHSQPPMNSQQFANKSNGMTVEPDDGL